MKFLSTRDMLSSDNFQYVSNRRYLCSIAFARLDVTPRHERLRNRVTGEKVLSTPINLDLLRQGKFRSRKGLSLNWIPTRLQLQSLITIASRAVKFSNSVAIYFTIYLRSVCIKESQISCSKLPISYSDKSLEILLKKSRDKIHPKLSRNLEETAYNF